MGKVFDAAIKGTTQKAIKTIVGKSGGKLERYLRKLKKGKSNKGFTWKVKEDKGGKIRILDVKKV